MDIDLAAVVDWGTFHGVFREFKVRCPEQYDSLIDCTAFVNWRRVEAGNDPVLVLAFCT